MILSRNTTQKRLGPVSNRNTTGSQVGSFNLRLIVLDKLTKPGVVPEIKELAEKLAEVVNVQRVRAIAPKFPDIHWIEFELELQPNTELSYEIWDKVQDIVIDYEWKLRDESGEKWYFHVQVVTKLSSLQDNTRIVYPLQIKLD